MISSGLLIKKEENMEVLVVGGGGREHAIVWKIAQSPKVTKIYCAPGNAGIAELAECVDISAADIPALVDFAKKEAIDLTIVGMDDPLMLGIVDEFEQEGLRVFGPRKNAAIIEGSKVFSKDLMKKYEIPTALYEVFHDEEKAKEFLKKNNTFPIVLKADGLALGKGVLICSDIEEALAGVDEIMVDKKFGEAGNQLVIEEFMTGHEVSVLAFCDGETVIPMVSAQDHKRALDGDKGLNTGGMGTFSPSQYYTRDLEETCLNTLFKPTLQAMKKEGRPFIGILFFGLMLTQEGPKVLEYNARFGDPEAQVVLPRLRTDLIDIIEACIDRRLNSINIEWKEGAAICIVLASGGYPVSYNKGYPIHGLDPLKNAEDCIVFHAGTKYESDQVVTNGGRVLGVTTLGKDLQDAIERGYEYVKQIDFQDKHYRTDIGKK